MDLVSAVRNGVSEALIEHGFDDKAGQSLAQSWIDVLNSPKAASIDLYLKQPQFTFFFLLFNYEKGVSCEALF